MMHVYDVVVRVRGSLTKEVSMFRFSEQGFPLLDRYLKHIALWDAGCYITWEWNHSVRFVGLSQVTLQKVISPKLEIPRSTSVTENWLLVVSGHQLSQCMGLPCADELSEYKELNGMLSHGPYDKIYIFQYMFDRVLLWEFPSGWTELKKQFFSGGNPN